MAIFQNNTAELRDGIARSTAYARRFLTELCDEGTFLEIGTYVKNSTDGNALEGVVTGCGAVDGRPIFLFVQDHDNGRAAFTAAQGKKIAALYDAALRAKAPVVGVFSGAGAKLSEGIDCLSAYGAVMKKVTEAKNAIPQIAVIVGPCGGASAVLSELFDFTVATDKAQKYLLPTATPKTGLPQADCVCSEETVAARVKELLNYLPLNSSEGTVCGMYSEVVNTPVENIASLTAEGSDVKNLLAALSDDGKYLEIKAEEASELVCGFLTLAGRVIGAVASQPAVKDGVLSTKAARKAARFVDFLGRFGIPCLTLVNTVGLGGEDKPCYVRALADLSAAYADCPSPKVTAVLGRAYGSAFTFLGAKALGADFVFALDSAVISVLPPETAVEFVWDERLRSADDPETARALLKAEWEATVATPLAAARSGDIDDVIAEGELKQRIAAAFEILG